MYQTSTNRQNTLTVKDNITKDYHCTLTGGISTQPRHMYQKHQKAYRQSSLAEMKDENIPIL